MYNLEYYGFSLLCRIQQECNSHFKGAPDFFSSSSVSSGSIFNLIPGIRRDYSYRPNYGCILDFSCLVRDDCPAEIAELDLIRRLFGGKLTSDVVNCISESCKEVGIADQLYRLSQWTPDRKRSTLLLADNSRERSRWIAASLGNHESLRAYAYGGVQNVEKLQRRTGVKHILSDYDIEVSTITCSKLCEVFMDLARDQNLFNTNARN